MTMGEMIRYQRKRLDLSQEELGAKLSPPVNKAAINKWETGTVENIKRTHIQQMAKMFELSPCELMCWEDTQSLTLFKKDAKTDELISIFSQFNEDGKEEVIKYANYIASQRKYEDVKKESLNA